MRFFIPRRLLPTLLLIFVLAANAVASNNYWIGNAPDVSQVDTITIANTWAQNDTVSVTINSKAVTVTVGTSFSTSDVAAIVAAAINSDDGVGDTDDLVGDESKNIGGQTIIEFRDIEASVTGSVVTVTGTVPGRPFEMNVTESTAGSGTATEATATSATGRHHYDNDSNWSTGTAPANTDNVFFARGNVDVKYGMDGSVTLDAFQRMPGYTGTIGLTRENTDHGESYYEYRNRFLRAEPSSAGKIYRINARQGHTFLNIADESASIVIENSPVVAGEYSHSVSIITGAGLATVTIINGHVVLGAYGEKSCDTAAIVVGNSNTNSASLHLSTDIDLSGATLTLNSGQVHLDAALGGAATVYGGTLVVESSAQPTINLRGGNLVYNGIGTLTTLNNYQGHADFSQDGRAKTVTNANLWRGSRLSDPQGIVTFTNGIDLEDCGLHEVEIISAPSLTWTPSAL